MSLHSNYAFVVTISQKLGRELLRISHANPDFPAWIRQKIERPAEPEKQLPDRSIEVALFMAEPELDFVADEDRPVQLRIRLQGTVRFEGVGLPTLQAKVSDAFTLQPQITCNPGKNGEGYELGFSLKNSLPNERDFQWEGPNPTASYGIDSGQIAAGIILAAIQLDTSAWRFSPPYLSD
ncbi:MAG: hypothetical protein KC457_31295, partial [Myxococcales bacterium]|nr:hypothetical protein [Myxococcales bacterium]